ncbi:MAG: hypothetical protein ACLRNZ_10870 [Blautia massiliensis (ex Durand et al. 2017)]
MEKGNCMSVGIFCIAADGDCFGAGNSERAADRYAAHTAAAGSKNADAVQTCQKKRQIVQSSGEQSGADMRIWTDRSAVRQSRRSGSLENGQTGQPSGNQSGSMENGRDSSKGSQAISQGPRAENGQAGQPSGERSGFGRKRDRQIRHRIGSQKAQRFI